jgi:translocator protein
MSSEVVGSDEVPGTDKLEEPMKRTAGGVAERHDRRLAWLTLLLFLVLVAGGGLIIGFVTRPGDWYAGLAKPAFSPPNWIFGPVWTALYVLIAVAGWRIWMRSRRGWPMRLWWLQLVLNFLWSPLFFAAHRIDLALGVIVLMLVAILAFIATAWHVDRIASWLFMPYGIWVAFATLLNASTLLLN